MADLNRQMSEILESSSEIKVKLGILLRKYEDLYRDGNRQFRSEKIASLGFMEGLEEFRRLVLIVKRNKDVVGSLVRGISNLRPMSNFKFIEEDVPIKKTIKKKAVPRAAEYQSPSEPISREEM